jgi:hypothetical protein
MIGHQNIRIEKTATFGLRFLQALQIVEVIALSKEDRLAIVSSLDKMMWIGRKGKAGGTRHQIFTPI